MLQAVDDPLGGARQCGALAAASRAGRGTAKRGCRDSEGLAQLVFVPGFEIRNAAPGTFLLQLIPGLFPGRLDRRFLLDLLVLLFVLCSGRVELRHRLKE